MPSILGANSVSGYEISNSLRFNDGSAEKLTRTNSSGGSRQIFTHSFWYKRTTPGNIDVIFQVGTSTSTNTGFYTVTINGDDKLFVGGAATSYRQTNRLFRDPAAWYHIVLAFDTTDGTAANRCKIYVNGSQETSFTTNNTITQNLNTPVNENSKVHQISGNQIENTYYAAGYLADFNHIDGQQLDPSYFGETNDDGVWIPKKYTGTYGTNGFFFEFQQTGTSANSSGMGADTSGNDNHYAATNLAAIDVTTDTPTNNFATLVPALNMTLSEGNVKAVTSRTGNWDGVHSSIGVTSGKWYFEVKASRTEDNFRVIAGVAGNPENFTFLFNGQGASGDPLSSYSNTYPFYGKGVWLSHWYDEDYNSSSTASTQSSDDILQFALDMDNYKLWIGVNGQFKDNSNNNVSYSDVASGSSATVTIASGAYTNKTFFPAVALRDDEGADDNIAQINFGNPSFSISSGNSDGLYGNFEYAPPSGYYALCTKRLARFG